MEQILQSDLILFQPRLAPSYDGKVVIEQSIKEIQKKPFQIMGDGKIRFQLYYPNAQNVVIRDYVKKYELVKQGGYWVGSCDFGTGFIALFLSVDGCEVLSKYLPIGYGGNEPINYAEVPENNEILKNMACTHGSVCMDFLQSKITKRLERFVIYLPPDYHTNSQKRYPVLYLQHGHGENEMCWINQGKMNFIYDELIESKKAESSIVVMSCGMIYEEHEDKRILQIDKFEQLLINEIIPYIDGRYRTISDKEHRAMAGLSMGSLQTSIITFNHSQYFSYVGVFSGFVENFLTGKDNHLTKTKCEEFKKNIKLFYRAIGMDDEYISHFQDDDMFLEKKEIPCVRRIFEGGHEWKVWRRCFYDFIQLIFR